MTASRHTRMLDDDNKQDRSSFPVGNTPCNRADHVENLEKVGLGDGGVKLSDIEGSRWS